MKSFFKFLYYCFAFLFSAYLIYLNAKLYYKPDLSKGQATYYNQDVVDQLHFLKEEIHGNMGDEMQQIYPEGYFFSNVLYGLTWSEILASADKKSVLYKEGIAEIDLALKNLYSDKGKQVFPEQLRPSYGIFYAGWTNYILAQKVKLENAPADIKLFEENCDSIATAFRESQNPYLESYAGLAWPADNIVAMASLAMHDKISGVKYDTLISTWLGKVKAHLDKDGLIPHKVNFPEMSVDGQAKGSSQSLLLVFLHDIDTTFARQQFNLYKKHFVDSRFGLPGIREHKKGISKGGDIDSGPVILSIGGSASLVGLKTMSIYNESEIVVPLRNSIEAFGMGYTTDDKKKFLFGAIPIADCFIAWVNTQSFTPEEQGPCCWRLKFQLICLVVISLLIGLGFYIRRK